MRTHIRIGATPPDIDPWQDYAHVHILQTDDEGRRFFAKPLEFVEISRDDCIAGVIQPTFQVCKKGQNDPLLEVFNQLWQLGYRPSDIGTAGHLAATQSHLADFRAIVAKTLDIKLP